MRKARWVEEYYRGGNSPAGPTAPVNEQVTIGMGRVPSPGVFAPMSAGGSRLTGSGMDGNTQPGKRAGEVHEGEGVLSANAMQALAPDEFHAFSRALEGGKLDKNSFRQSFGLPPVAGYSQGGIVGEEEPKQQLTATAPPPAAPIEAPQQKIFQPLSAQQPQVMAAPGSPSAPTPIQPPVIKPPPAITPPAVQPPLPSIYSEGMQQGYNSIRQTAQGDNPLDRTIANKTMNDLAARQQWQTIAGNQSLLNNNPNMSPEGRAAIMSQVTAGHSANTANVAGTMAIDAQRRAGDASRDLVTLGQSARSFELSEEEARARAQANADSDIGKRISTLLASTSLSGMQGDSVLREMVAKTLGPNATPEMINQEIAVQWASTNERAKASYASNAEILLGDMVDNKRSVSDALADGAIRRNIAGLLELDVNDSSAQARIEEEIKRRFEGVGKSTVDVMVDNFVKNDLIPPEYKGIEGWETDLKNTIRDLVTKGIMDKDGNIVAGATFDWPWEDPKSYFRYNDWNGNAVSGDYDHTAAVNISGNGTTYVTADGKSVTQENADAVWNSLNAAQREKYFSGGSPNVKAFMDDYFKGTLGPDGKPVPVITADDYLNKVIGNEKYAEYVKTLKDGWTSGMFNKELEDGTVITQGEFVYYDLNGKMQIASKEDPALGYIWEQLTQSLAPDKYAKGELLTAEQFANAWGDGKGWFVDSDGRITNLDSKGKNAAGEQAALSVYEAWSPVKYSDRNSANGLMLESEAAAISSQWASLPAEKKTTGPDNWIENTSFITWNKNQWNITAEAQKWVLENQGKLYKAKDGRVYQILGFSQDHRSGTTDSVIMRDVVTGKEIDFSNGGGKSTHRPLTGEAYAA